MQEISFCSLFFLSSCALAVEWEDPSVNSIDRLPPRTFSVPLRTEADALTPDLEPVSPYVMSLNGTWKFSWAGNPALRTVDFWKRDFDDSDWHSVNVPGCVELQGFGSPSYTNVRYPHANAAPRILDRQSGRPDYNPVSSYRRSFEIPECWRGRDVILRFEGVASAFYVWVNGRRVGYAEDSKLPSEFDVTPYLDFRPSASNLLCVEVYRWCDDSYLEDQDMFRFSGIIRDVTLWSSPRNGVWDFQVKTRSAGGHGNWKLDVKVDGRGPERTEVFLYDGGGRKVCDLAAASPAGVYTATLAARPWSAEDPYLYTLVIRKGTDIRMKRVGFKEQKVVGNRFLINGRAVKLHGVNRHECSPTNGRSVTLAEMEKDVILMKRHNVDTVRTSHYPNHRLWYDLCDRHGLYVIAEANVEGHEPGFGEKGLGRFPEWDTTIVERNVRHVQFYRNNPCVILWSLGNETGHGDCFRHAASGVRGADGERPIHWERGNFDADVDSSMYPWVEWLEERGRLGDLPKGTEWRQDLFCGLSTNDEQTAGKPYVMCEYAHAMGNALGSLSDYWDVVYRYDSLMGGCIWDWADQAIWKTTGLVDPLTGTPERYLAYGGDFDESPNDGPFCCNGLVGADRKATAKLAEVAHVYRPVAVVRADDGGFRLLNRMAFRTASCLAGTWSVRKNGEIAASARFEVPAVAPLSSGELQVNDLMSVVKAMSPGDEAFAEFAFETTADSGWAPRGLVVARDQLRITPECSMAVPVKGSHGGKLDVKETESSVTVACCRTQAVFDRRSGTLMRLSMNGMDVLGQSAEGAPAGPRLTCGRALTDNDIWMREAFYFSGLSQLRYHARPIRIVGSSVRTVVDVTGSKSAGFMHVSDWKFLSDGAIEIAHEIVPHGSMPCVDMKDNPYVNDVTVLPRLGLSLRLHASLETLSWYGRGPGENYIDRCASSFMGVWSSTVTGRYNDYVRPQENGGMCDVRWVVFSRGDGCGVRFSASMPMFVQALHYSADDLEFARPRRGQPRFRALPRQRGDVFVNLDIRQMGLGGRSCGPEPQAKYMFPIGTEKWLLRIEPAQSGIGGFKEKTDMDVMPGSEVVGKTEVLQTRR